MPSPLLVRTAAATGRGSGDNGGGQETPTRLSSFTVMSQRDGSPGNRHWLNVTNGQTSLGTPHGSTPGSGLRHDPHTRDDRSHHCVVPHGYSRPVVSCRRRRRSTIVGSGNGRSHGVANSGLRSSWFSPVVQPSSSPRSPRRADPPADSLRSAQRPTVPHDASSATGPSSTTNGKDPPNAERVPVDVLMSTVHAGPGDTSMDDALGR